MKTKRITIDDVAERAGVSKGTVSAVINGKDTVRPETREQILEVMRELNFRPKGVARNLKNGSRDKSIGIIVKDLTYPFYTSIATGAREYADSKGYSVLVIEKGREFHDLDFATTNWHFWKYLWMPALFARGILQISLLKGVMVLHGAGLGGGSLGYSCVLEVPSPETFETPAWKNPVKWGKLLTSHYETAKKMLGVARNPRLWKADQVLRDMAENTGMEDTFRPTEVGIYFGDGERTVPDPYFDGQGPERAGCRPPRCFPAPRWRRRASSCRRWTAGSGAATHRRPSPR